MEGLGKKGDKNLIFKVDFEKAYDSLGWSFLKDVMQLMGFGDKWIEWMITCLYGSPSKEFQSERGIR